MQAKADPAEAEYKKMRTADNNVDASIEELDDAVQGAKTLAPKAGGDAKQALGTVVSLLNGAGETLDDYDEAADTLEEFKKEFAAQDDRRIRNIRVSNEALSKISDAYDILGDLTANVPGQYKDDLKQISDNVDQAQSDLQDVVTGLGGQLPEDPNPESVDPAQEKSKNP
jgi:ABC-type transporter Mla subunit MlaD